jgi:hypothetical protein
MLDAWKRQVLCKISHKTGWHHRSSIGHRTIATVACLEQTNDIQIQDWLINRPLLDPVLSSVNNMRICEVVIMMCLGLLWSFTTTSALYSSFLSGPFTLLLPLLSVDDGSKDQYRYHRHHHPPTLNKETQQLRKKRMGRKRNCRWLLFGWLDRSSWSKSGWCGPLWTRLQHR